MSPASSSFPPGSPEAMNCQPLRRMTWRTSKATMLVFSPLELVRSVTFSTISGRVPAASARARASASTSARTSLYFSSPTKVLPDFFANTVAEKL